MVEFKRNQYISVADLLKDKKAELWSRFLLAILLFGCHFSLDERSCGQNISGRLFFLGRPFLLFFIRPLKHQVIARCRQMYIYTNKIFHKHTSLIFTLLGASSASVAFLIQRLSEVYFPGMRDMVVYFTIVLFGIAGAIIGKMIYELHYMAMFDFLTRLGNRWYFSIRLAQEIEKTKNGDYLVCMAAIDVDNFKQVNDKLGHSAGDDVLVNISNIFRRHTRNMDAIARWGGDEFVILFPDTDIELATAITGTLKDAVLNSDDCREATLSIGVVPIDKNWDKKKVLQEVDLMLRVAKKTKNSVVSLASD